MLSSLKVSGAIAFIPSKNMTAPFENTHAKNTAHTTPSAIPMSLFAEFKTGSLNTEFITKDTTVQAIIETVNMSMRATAHESA